MTPLRGYCLVAAAAICMTGWHHACYAKDLGREHGMRLVGETNINSWSELGRCSNAERDWIVLCGPGDEVLLFSDRSKIILRENSMLWLCVAFPQADEAITAVTLKGAPLYLSRGMDKARELLRRASSDGLVSWGSSRHRRWRLGARLEIARERVIVDDVEPGSPAAVAGLRRGDEVIEIQGEKVQLRAEWIDAMIQNKAGESGIGLLVLRGGMQHHITVFPELVSFDGKGSYFEGDAVGVFVQGGRGGD